MLVLKFLTELILWKFNKLPQMLTLILFNLKAELYEFIIF